MERDNIGYKPPVIPFISTHTLTWSVTLVVLCDTARVTDFNSHAHVERDALTSPLYHFTTLISTHTLTWSVTQLSS